MKTRVLIPLCLLSSAFVVGCVGEGSAAASFSSVRSGPLTLLAGSTGSGYPLRGGGPSGSTIRFINQGTFWIAMLVRNDSRKPVTLVQASTWEPPDSLVRETRGAFARYTPCNGNAPCIWPTRSTSTRPLMLPPHAQAAIKLNYQLVSCRTAAASTTGSGNTLVIRYRYGTGPASNDVVPLGYGQLHLLRPAGVECLPRPYSYIGLVGSFTTSPEHKPMPGSTGDRCWKSSSGGLAFTSRAFTDRSGTTFQIEITIPHYQGVGSYHSGSKSLGPVEVTAVGWFGTPGPTTIFHDPNATVTVTTAHGTTLGGNLAAVFSGHRRFFRAYGHWRCTTHR